MDKVIVYIDLVGTLTYTSVLERKKEIGILRAIRYRPADRIKTAEEAAWNTA